MPGHSRSHREDAWVSIMQIQNVFRVTGQGFEWCWTQSTPHRRNYWKTQWFCQPQKQQCFFRKNSSSTVKLGRLSLSLKRGSWPCLRLRMLLRTTSAWHLFWMISEHWSLVIWNACPVKNGHGYGSCRLWVERQDLDSQQALKRYCARHSAVPISECRTSWMLLWITQGSHWNYQWCSRLLSTVLDDFGANFAFYGEVPDNLRGWHPGNLFTPENIWFF